MPALVADRRAELCRLALHETVVLHDVDGSPIPLCDEEDCSSKAIACLGRAIEALNEACAHLADGTKEVGDSVDVEAARAETCLARCTAELHRLIELGFSADKRDTAALLAMGFASTDSTF